MKQIELNLHDGGKVVLVVEAIHTIAATKKGSIVTTVENGKVSGTYTVYEAPSRIRSMMSI